MKNVAIAVLATSLAFVVAGHFVLMRRQSQQSLDSTAATLVRSACLQWDYQYEHPVTPPPCKSTSSYGCVTFELWNASPTLEFGVANGEIGRIDCLDYQN
jgi:hypothetical protein